MSFNFNFDDDDEDIPFDINEITKFIQHMQHNIMKQLRDQGIDPNQMDLSDLQEMLGGMGQGDNPNVKRFGFSISMGPDGKPNIQPLDGKNIPFEMPTKSQNSGNGFEEPFVDVFYSHETKQYQIIAEVQGVEHPDHVVLNADDDGLMIHAETGPFKYRKTLELNHPIDSDTMSYTIQNGVLEITAKSH